MTTVFLSGPDYEVSSGPLIIRRAHIDDVWPEGAGASKDDLEPGMHVFFAIGPKGQRPQNVVGMVISYDTLTDLIELNVAPGSIYRAYVANVLTYNAGSPNTYEATLDKHVPVWVDDSTDLAAGVTLSRSPANEAAAANPLCGFTWPDQDEWTDSGVGGGNTDPYPKSYASGVATAYLLTPVMLWPSSED
jgi:hypothetical protein